MTSFTSLRQTGKVNTRSEQLQIYPYLISGTSIAMVILAFCI